MGRKNQVRNRNRKPQKNGKILEVFLCINLPERKIQHAHGIGEWLGYPYANFALFDYFRIIDPKNLATLNMSVQSAFATANSDAFSLKFMGQKIVIQIPLLHANGKYILIKRTRYPYQIDTKAGMVTSYLNH